MKKNTKIIFSSSVDRIVIWAGERVDFVVNANQTSKNYWIKVRGFGQCAKKNVCQGAILHYVSTSLHYPTEPLHYEENERNESVRVCKPSNDSIL